MSIPNISVIVILTLVGGCCYFTSGLESTDSFQLTYDSDERHFNEVLSNILVPRVVGSQGHRNVQNYIIQHMENLGFTTDTDQFSTGVPVFGNLTFTNIIAKFNPEADAFLSLACHYDSKFFREDPNFVGATDSAVPCTIMINIAKTLMPYLKENVLGRSDIGLMYIFFDGEEAFQEWNEQDSIYGSRHLAKKMSNSINTMYDGRPTRHIDQIEVMVLLDLIGAANPKFYSFYPNTHALHSTLSRIERALFNQRVLEGSNLMFMRRIAPGFVDDDHRPFLNKNVPILHLISLPFPKQWHTPWDNAENLDWPSIRNFNKILRVFVREYLNRHTKEITFRN